MEGPKPDVQGIGAKVIEALEWVSDRPASGVVIGVVLAIIIILVTIRRSGY